MSINPSNLILPNLAKKRGIDPNDKDAVDSSLKKQRNHSVLHPFIEELSEREKNLCDHIHGRIISCYKILLKIHSSTEENKASWQDRLNNSLTLQLQVLENWHIRLQPFSMLFLLGKKNDVRQLQFPLKVQNPMKTEETLNLTSKDDYDLVKEKFWEVSECLQSLLYQIRQVGNAQALLQEKNRANWEKRIKQLVKTKPRDLWLFGKVHFS
jgi:hypothetical protein